MDSIVSSILAAALATAAPRQLAVAFSGGVDSSALLHVLAQLPAARAARLRAVHVDHGLHADSAAWAAHCETVCAALQVPLQILHCEVARDSGVGIEAAARHARYAALATNLQPGEWLATAQHMDDQAETLLLRLMRASGTSALGAMRSTRALGEGILWRPLLSVSREALLNYAKSQALHWIEDPSNCNPLHDRSWLRNELIPLLRSRWPHASESLARSAGLLAADAELLDTRILDALAGCVSGESTTLAIDRLMELVPSLRAHVLRRWLSDNGADRLPAHLHTRIETDLIGAAADAQPLIRYRQTRIQRYRGSLHVEVGALVADEDMDVRWDGLSPLSLPDGSQLRFDPGWTGGVLRVTYRRGGERLRLPGRAHHHSLKFLLQKAGIEPWKRTRLPLIWDADGRLLAAGDQLISAELSECLETANGRLTWT